MGLPTIRLVFDRKHVATKKVKGLVQVEVTYKRKRKYIGTGIKLYADQWNVRRHVVNSPNMIETNDYLNGMVSGLERWLMASFAHVEFNWTSLENYLDRLRRTDDFIEFVEDAIKSRNDIRESTRKAHMKLVGLLREYNRIIGFGDLTTDGIYEFDNWMHGRKIKKIRKDGTEYESPMAQPTIYTYHKLMKTYIHIAIRKGIIEKDPYQYLHFKRGESKPGRFLSEDELRKLMAAPMRSGCVARARDVFVFQCYTGLAYSDLRSFDFTHTEEHDGDYTYSGERKKTGEHFFFILLPKAMEILRKYDYKLPVTAEQRYNSNLKKVAEDAGIDKPLASHWGRRTAAVIFINNGVRLEVVAKILGHSSVTTTEQYYTEIIQRTVADEMKKSGL